MMNTRFASTRLAPLAISLTLLATLTGCYKSDFEAEKKKTADLQTQIDAIKADLNNASKRAADGQVAIAELNKLRTTGGVMSTFGWTGGQWVLVGQDSIRLNDSNVFVRHGERKRENGSLRFIDGKLADQTFTLNSSSSAAKVVEGSIKGGKADGIWTWFSKDGKPTNRETFADGKLVSVERITIGKDNKPTYTKLPKAEAEKFSKAQSARFAAISELDRPV
jgi:hypothetical protein